MGRKIKKKLIFLANGLVLTSVRRIHYLHFRRCLGVSTHLFGGSDGLVLVGDRGELGERLRRAVGEQGENGNNIKHNRGDGYCGAFKNSGPLPLSHYPITPLPLKYL